MKGVVWLASYPKSGNTWLRFMLHNYIYGSTRRSEDVAKRIPDIHEDEGISMIRPSEQMLCKSHFLWSPQHPFHDETASFIYVMRHPRDVLLSNLNYVRMVTDLGFENDRKFARAFIANRGVWTWIKKGMGTWPEHADSWLVNSGLPHILLRYESMLRDPHTSLRSVLEFLGLPVEQIRLNRAVHLSSFSKMRALEDSENKKGQFSSVFHSNQAARERGLHFMNQGKAGQTLRHLGDDMDQLFRDRFADDMRRYGYE